MSKRRKKSKLKALFLIIILIIFMYFFIKSIFFANTDNNSLLLNNNDKTNLIDIINTSESNSNIIEKKFASGMNIEDFTKINNQKDNYLKSDDSYKQLKYNFNYKLHYSKIEEYLKELNNSEIVKLELIGVSVDKRNIYSVEIGKGNKTLLIDANIHSAESGNTLILLKYMIDIVNKYENKNKDIVEKLNNYKIVILPCINPDGYEVYNYGIEVINNRDLWIYKNKDNIDFENFKFNANGVDINRNMPTQNAGLYYKDKALINSVAFEKTTKNGIYFGGSSLGREPETKALMYFMLKHFKNTFAYINMHSQGRVIYQGKPNLNSKFNDKSNSLAKYVSKDNNYIVYGIESEEVAEGNDGSATDFMAELANGFLFSSKTGRLSIDKYNGQTNFKYNYGVITVETIKTYTDDPSYFKTEYYDYNYFNLFTNLLSTNSY